jgi:hypothetical protein
MMGGMDEGVRVDRAGPPAVRLHLHRGIGWGFYGTAAALMLLVGLFVPPGYLRDGRWWMAGLTAAAALALALFFAILTYAMVVPELTATAAGISGRMPRAGAVEVAWEGVTIDVDEDALPGTIRLDLGEESVSVNPRAWVGFEPFVGLVCGTPRAAARMTPAARHAVARPGPSGQ